jgi:hypothetical protein
MNVDHITSKNFGNYKKWPNFQEIFEVFGGSILNSDSNEWKQERIMIHSFLKRKSKNFFQKTIQKILENSLL